MKGIVWWVIFVSALGRLGWGEELPLLRWENTSLTETDWEKIAQQKKPFHLEFSQIRLSQSDFVRLAENRNVGKLVLWGCEGMNDQCFSLLGEMPQLQSLVVDAKDNLTDKGFPSIPKWKNLRCLHLYDYRMFTDDGMTQLASLEHLEKLHLTGCDISVEGLRKLKNLGV